MLITKEEILDAISKMSVLDVMQLVSMIEEKFGISSSSTKTILNTSIETSVIEETEEKSEFDVKLVSIGANKISVIKAIRSIISLGLKEAKDLVESAPVLIKEKIGKDEADSVKKILEDVGASVEIN